MTYECNIAPFINIIFWVTSEFWEPRSYYHKGLDIATATVEGNVPVYSMCNGTVIFSGAQTDGQGNYTGYGNYIIMRDDTTGLGFLYAHLERRDVSQGDHIVVGQLVGLEGTTGDSTGIHLHLEMQDLSNRGWIFNGSRADYLNPADFLGIPNVEGTACHYSGTPYVPTVDTFKKHKFNFIFYNSRKRRLNY